MSDLIIFIALVSLALHNLRLQYQLDKTKWVVKVMINDIYSDEDEDNG